MGVYGSVLVGTDGSASATRAVDQAARLAAGCGARLTIVTAVKSESNGGEDAAGPLDWELHDDESAGGRLSDAVNMASNLGVRDVASFRWVGEPADVILRAGDHVDADVIVVGSLGMAGPGRFLVGSVPNSVSHRAACDVLIVQTT